LAATPGCNSWLQILAANPANAVSGWSVAQVTIADKPSN